MCNQNACFLFMCVFKTEIFHYGKMSVIYEFKAHGVFKIVY